MHPSTEKQVLPTRGRQHWVLLTALFTAANFLEVVLFSNLIAFTPLFLQGLGFDDAAIKFWTGMLTSLSVGLGFWFVPFWGVLADRHGRKLLILRSFAVEGVAMILMALSPNIWIFLFARMILGLALGNTGLMFATIADNAPRERVGLAISIVTGSAPLGGVVGALLGGYVISQFGVRVLFGLDAVMIGLVTLMLGLLYQESFVPGTIQPLGRMLREALRAVLRTPHVSTLFAFSFVATCGFFFSYPYISNRVLQLVGSGDPAFTIGLVFGIAGIATLVATPLWGMMADRVGHRRLLPLATLLTAIFYLPLFVANDLVQFTIALFFLFGVSNAVNSLTFAVIGLETPTAKRGAVMSMIFMPINAAILFSPALASLLTREVREVFIYSALFTFGAFVLLWVINGVKIPVPATEAE